MNVEIVVTHKVICGGKMGLQFNCNICGEPFKTSQVSAHSNRHAGQCHLDCLLDELETRDEKIQLIISVMKFEQTMFDEAIERKVKNGKILQTTLENIYNKEKLQKGELNGEKDEQENTT